MINSINFRNVSDTANVDFFEMINNNSIYNTSLNLYFSVLNNPLTDFNMQLQANMKFTESHDGVNGKETNTYTIIDGSYSRDSDSGYFLGKRNMWMQFGHYINDSQSAMLLEYEIRSMTIEKTRTATSVTDNVLTLENATSTSDSEWIITRLTSCDDGTGSECFAAISGGYISFTHIIGNKMAVQYQYPIDSGYFAAGYMQVDYCNKNFKKYRRSKMGFYRW